MRSDDEQKRNQQMRVIVAEDDLMVADLLEEILAGAGFQVCGIGRTVEAAIEIARRHRPELAIFDLCLADGGLGSEIIEQLEPSWPLGVLIASGIANSIPLSTAHGTAIILKPYTATDILAALQIVRDVMVSGATSRPLPRGVRLLAAERSAPDTPHRTPVDANGFQPSLGVG